MLAFFICNLLRFIALFPLPTVHAIATYIGRWLARQTHWRIVQTTHTNLRLCYPHLSDVERAQLAQESLIETCKTSIELGALWLWSKTKLQDLVQQVTGEAYLQQALQQGRGVILLTPHLGAWEMAGLYASIHYNIVSLYRPPKQAGLHTFIQRGRQRLGAHLVPTDSKGIRALFSSLKQGNLAGILPDQVPVKANAGVFAPFFNVPAYTLLLVARLAQKTQAPVIFTFAERLPQGAGFRIHFLPAPTEINAMDVETATTALNQGITTCIQQCPAQYQWSYKRFKRRPEGQADVYNC